MTPLFRESQRHPSKLGVFTGSLENIDINLIKFTKNVFVEDTIDGSASVWFTKPNANGKEIPRYRDFEGEISWDLSQASNSSELWFKQEYESIPLQYHYKGIQLIVNRGNHAT